MTVKRAYAALSLPFDEQHHEIWDLFISAEHISLNAVRKQTSKNLHVAIRAGCVFDSSLEALAITLEGNRSTRELRIKHRLA